MSAQWDRSQKIAFHYGNAARDLNEFLPADDFVKSDSATSATASEIKELLALVDTATGHMTRIENSHKQLSFLLADLKRLIG